MGHTRLGSIPKSKKWSEVVNSFSQSFASKDVSSDFTKIVSSQSIDAASKGLDLVLDDDGLQYTFYLLSQIAIKSREDNWIDELKQIGIKVNKDSNLFDLTYELQDHIDEYLSDKNANSDISEMAQQAAGEALNDLTSESMDSLFESTSNDLQISIKELSNKSGLSDLGQSFFGHFTKRFLNFYLSRISAAYIGQGHVNHTVDLQSFNKDLEKHCYQSAKIVKQFTGDWLSKTNYEEGISRANIKKFLSVALRKIQAELLQQKEDFRNEN